MTNCPFIRYALVRNATSRAQAEAYLPSGYRVIHETQMQARAGSHYGSETVYVIEGRDEAGWTLDGYVIPRYASGLIWAEEIDLSHPVMKEVPA